MTIAGPILFAALMIAPAILMKLKDEDYKKIAYIDETGLFNKSLKSTDYVEFNDISLQYYDELTNSYNLTKAKADLKDLDYYALLYIPVNAVSTQKGSVQLISYQQPNMGVKMHIANCLEKRIEDVKLSTKAEEYGITEQQVEEILLVVNTNINVITTTLDDNGGEKESSTEIAMIIAYICGFLIYLFVFMYGNQVMRGVIEEKSSRIIELIVSSVRPFQLMAGKIIGVALVGLTQFCIWILLTFSLVSIAQNVLLKDFDLQQLTTQEMASTNINSTLNQGDAIQDAAANKFEGIFKAVFSINYFTILSIFLFYFIFGYLFYASMFAIVGSAVDNETDTQQFMMPISLPLMLGILIMLPSINNPTGDLAFWFSMIPFTSPIVMMARIPFGVPTIEIIISGLVLILSFILMTWLASKIYRVGILMYGKKVTYKELWKWFRYKN